MAVDAFPDPFVALSGHVDIRTKSAGVPREVLEAYGLSNATVTKLDTSSFNVHYAIETAAAKYDLRHSNRAIDVSNLEYEAELLVHLRERGFVLAPEIVKTTTGTPNFWFGDDGWTLFRWMDAANLDSRPQMNEARTANAARTLAAFHLATKDFRPKSRRPEWPIFSKAEDWTDRWADRADKLAAHLGDDEFRDEFLALAHRAARDLDDVDFAKLPVTCCHADYRTRNMRFDDHDDSVAAVFDLDTAMCSTRLFDLGGAATRFSTTGKVTADVDAGVRFLRAYDTAAPLTAYEWHVLPIFIRWRLIRDVAIYFDRWWLNVRDACNALFAGAAADIVAGCAASPSSSAAP